MLVPSNILTLGEQWLVDVLVQVSLLYFSELPSNLHVDSKVKSYLFSFLEQRVHPVFRRGRIDSASAFRCCLPERHSSHKISSHLASFPSRFLKLMSQVRAS